MAAPRLADRIRERLLALLSDDRPDADRLLDRLVHLRRLDEVAACSGALRVLVKLDLPESHAERVLREILRHRASMQQQLGRDPGLRVAAMDYLSNVERLLNNPTVVELKQFERTEHSAVTDSLTGLYNRRYFRAAMRREVRRGGRYDLTFSLLMLDLDDLKLANDTFGHPYGDDVLKRTGGLIRRSVREADIPCRYGGDEFAVIAPETGRLGAYTVADRIRRSVAETFAAEATDERQFAITISAGVACFTEDGADPATLIARADATLYGAKRAGRNRVRLHPDERRRAVRYPASPSARVGIVRVQPQQLEKVRPINLSIGGALLETRAPYRPEDPVRLALGTPNPATDGWEEVDAEVVRVEGPPDGGGRLKIGIQFAHPIAEPLLMAHVLRASRQPGESPA